jgi:hypothetical protein
MIVSFAIRQSQSVVVSLHASSTNTTGRYSSELEFSAACIDYLNSYQVSIKDIHIAGCDPLHLIAQSRQNITAYFGAEAKNHTFVQFARNLKPLDSLSLNFPGGWNKYDDHYWQNAVDPLAGHRISTRSLTITGCMPRSFGDKVGEIFDWSMLTCLNLFEGNLWLLQDIHAQQYDTPEFCNLVRFQCYTSDHIFEHDTTMLHSFFERNESLRHILLSISGIARLPVDTPEQLELDNPTIGDYFVLWPLRHQLQTLVWHNPSQAHRPTQVKPLSARSLECICRNFTQLRELGITAPQRFNNDRNMGTTWEEDLLQYLVGLGSDRYCYVLW